MDRLLKRQGPVMVVGAWARMEREAGHGIILFYTHTTSYRAFIDSNATGFQARSLAPQLSPASSLNQRNVSGTHIRRNLIGKRTVEIPRSLVQIQYFLKLAAAFCIDLFSIAFSV